MLTAPFNPREEKEALYSAVCRFPEQWKQVPRVAAILDLCDATERADGALQTLEAQETLDRDTRLQAAVQLRIFLTTAKQTLEAIQGEPLTAVNVYPVSEKQEPTPETVFPAGTLLVCPPCGEGPDKVIAKADMLLGPLSTTDVSAKTTRDPRCGNTFEKRKEQLMIQKGGTGYGNYTNVEISRGSRPAQSSGN